VRLIVEGYRNIFGGKDPNSGLTSGSPPWQCTCAWCVKSLRVPGQDIHYKMGHPPYSPDLALWVSMWGTTT
jgi:hypothetical protein